ncbi:hypothetical protein IKF57_01535 [Candidatus Saccharibacteria bacterium]|nr:hypothetical protein [Candidatus Saccharibacteria bacterium]
MRKKYLPYILTILFSLFVSSSAFSADTAVDTVDVFVPESCTMSTASGSGENYAVGVKNGQYKNDIGKTRLSVFCNTNESFAIYAVGYSGDTLGNTDMVTSGTGTNIVTGTATTGPTSNWAMKIESVAATSGSYTPSVISPFDDFAAIPSTYTKVAEIASVTSGSNPEGAIEATYAVYASPTQNFGPYTGKVRYTVVHPNNAAPPTPGLLGITNMQDMTPEICAESTIGDEKQLIDSRDNKSYWVAKLADGKCWMTQNLDLDLSTSKTLTPSDSDVTSNWTPTRGTIDASAVTNNSIPNWSDDNNTPYSVDPGNWYWNALPFYDSTNNNFLAGSGGTKFQKNTPYANNGEHGHVGNYYNWSAAVAMNSTSGYTSSTLANPANNPQTSICPKGWRLPTISNASNTTAGSTNEFGRLNQLYNSGSTSTSQNLEAAPLYFVRSGYVLSSQQYSAGNNGNYWSSSVDSSSGAYDLYFSSSYVNPTNDLSRYDGFSVRCVAR